MHANDSLSCTLVVHRTAPRARWHSAYIAHDLGRASSTVGGVYARASPSVPFRPSSSRGTVVGKLASPIMRRCACGNARSSSMRANALVRCAHPSSRPSPGHPFIACLARLRLALCPSFSRGILLGTSRSRDRTLKPPRSAYDTALKLIPDYEN